jgi:hypothetical protein
MNNIALELSIGYTENMKMSDKNNITLINIHACLRIINIVQTR